jgi:hypothetical protein
VSRRRGLARKPANPLQHSVSAMAIKDTRRRVYNVDTFYKARGRMRITRPALLLSLLPCRACDSSQIRPRRVSGYAALSRRIASFKVRDPQVRAHQVRLATSSRPWRAAPSICGAMSAGRCWGSPDRRAARTARAGRVRAKCTAAENLKCGDETPISDLSDVSERRLISDLFDVSPCFSCYAWRTLFSRPVRRGVTDRWVRAFWVESVSDSG